MDVPGVFRLFSFEHGAILGAIVIAGCALGFALRSSEHLRIVLPRTLGILLAGLELTWYVHLLGSGLVVWPGSLPLHLCDVVLWATVITSIFRWPNGFDIIYYWGLAGTTMALLTPDVQGMRFTYPVIQFFVSHGLTIVIILTLVLSRAMTPRPKSLYKALIALHVYAALVFVFNELSGSNYMFLSSKPGGTTLFDIMGPWPVYIFVSDALGLVLFWLLWLPFRRQAQSAPGT